MARERTVHRCEACGATSPRWAGRCAACGAWNALVEEADPRRRPVAAAGAVARPIEQCDPGGATPAATGVAELDRVLGGGLVPASVSLLGGEPGIGKSTLLLQALGSLAGRGARGLLVSAEESAAQVRRRAERLGAVVPGVWLLAETSLAGVIAASREIRPDVLVVDSVQTIWDTSVDSAPGSVAQVRACAQALAELARSSGAAVVLVGHVTKEGVLAGPRVLEHLVDTVLSFEGDRHHALRMLRAVKHRFGATGELGLFEMTGEGLAGVDDPAGLFLGDRRAGAPGSVVFPALEGRRPLLVEIQALVAPSGSGGGARAATGLDAGRLPTLLAVLERRAGVRLVGQDVYVSAIGGVRVSDPGADLAVCLAVTSAALNRSLPPELVALGEVGLGGEVRQVAQARPRLAEAARLGFRRAVGSPNLGGVEAGLAVHTYRDLVNALGALLPDVRRPPAGPSPSHPAAASSAHRFVDNSPPTRPHRQETGVVVNFRARQGRGVGGVGAGARPPPREERPVGS